MNTARIASAASIARQFAMGKCRASLLRRNGKPHPYMVAVSAALSNEGPPYRACRDSSSLVLALSPPAGTSFDTNCARWLVRTCVTGGGFVSDCRAILAPSWPMRSARLHDCTTAPTLRRASACLFCSTCSTRLRPAQAGRRTTAEASASLRRREQQTRADVHELRKHAWGEQGKSMDAARRYKPWHAILSTRGAC
jgi:hypothetical protein